MSNKSGTSSQVIFLPEDDNTLEGIDQTFSFGLCSDICSFTVPLALLPQHNRLQPELILVSKTETTSGLSESSWNLNILSISRKESTAILTCQGKGFVLDE